MAKEKEPVSFDRLRHQQMLTQVSPPGEVIIDPLPGTVPHSALDPNSGLTSGYLGTSYSLQSGAIRSGYYGHLPYQIASGAIGSGHPARHICSKCSKDILSVPVANSGQLPSDYIIVNSDQPYHPLKYLCGACADLERKGEALVLEFAGDAPWTVIADWYEDQGRQPDADWIRKYRSNQ